MIAKTTLAWVAAAGVAGAVGFGVGVSLGRRKQQSYHEQAKIKWASFQRWIEGGTKTDSPDRLRSVDELDNLLFELNRAGMREEQAALALVYEKIAAIIRTQNPPEQSLIWP